MKIWFDLTTPKQVLFFSFMGQFLEERGHDIRYTSRRYYEMNKLEKYFGLEVEPVGFHGGGSLEGKLMASVNRLPDLQQFAQSTSPSILVTLGGIESSRVAFGLGIPIVNFMDIPEAFHVCKLSLPLANVVIAPSFIPISEFDRYGIQSYMPYDSMDPCLWLEHWKVDEDIFKDMGLDTKEKIILVRDEEVMAAYLKGMKPLAIETALTLKEKHPHWQFVGIPRYSRKDFSGIPDIVIPKDVYDTQSMIAMADLFIGGGGTMNVEGAFFGTSVINTRPLQCRYEEELMIKNLTRKPKEWTVASTVTLCEHMIGKKNPQGARAIFNQWRFPINEIMDKIEEIGKTCH